MDLYTTSFLLPSPPLPPLPPSIPTNPSSPSHSPNGSPQIPQDGKLGGEPSSTDILHSLALEIGAREGCLVSVAPDPDGVGNGGVGKGWNWLLSGNYAQVMSARGVVMRNAPMKYQVRLKVPRSEILDNPLSTTSCALKPPVRAKLDSIASATQAIISVVNPDLQTDKLESSGKPSSGTNGQGGGDPGAVGAPLMQGSSAQATKGAFGLETERVCEIVVEGALGAIEVAKVRLLVMLDELSGLHSEVCSIDFKLHPIIASRKRHVIQTIQEETGTNIYFPTPLCGITPPTPAAFQPPMNPNMGMPPSPQFGGPTPHGYPAQMNVGGVYPPQGPMSPYPPHHQTSPLLHPQSPYPQHHSPQQHPYGPPPPHSPHPYHPPSPGPYGHQGNVTMPPRSPYLQNPGPGRSSSGHLSPAMNGMQPGSAPPMQQHFGSPHNPALDQIWVTGEFFGVQRARDMLHQIAGHKIRSKAIISRDTPILPRKLDWLLTDRLEDIKAAMIDNGTFISFPLVGSQGSLITVYGDQRVNIERTIRSVMHLACQFYVASIWLLPISFDVLMPSTTVNPSQIQPSLQRIANHTGAELVFKSMCFEIHGLEGQVRDAVSMVLDLDIVKNFHNEIRFQIELAGEHRDFISGKKNGKINKIMKLANVKIKFETFNEYNFLIDVGGGTAETALEGLSMLQEELPAEVSFHVPESYHKRIIGVGGKNIQKIMKKFGVYVKFSNAEEYAQLGGYTDNEDNVVARTPAKNAMALEQLKQSVMEMVNPKDKDYTLESVSIPRRYHRTLLGEKSIFIHDIEGKTNSTVRFPNKESASDVVTIFGPEAQVHIAAAMLLDHVPFEADLHVPYAADIAQVVSTHDFLQLVERLKRDLQIAIVPPTRFSLGDDSLFKFRCQRSNIDFLGTAKEALEEYLVSRQVGVYQSSTRGWADSYSDAFSHFNSALLPSKLAVESELEGQGESLVQRQPRAIASAQDVKALFDHGAFYSDASQGSTPPMPTGTPIDHAQPSPLNIGFAPPLSFGNGNRNAVINGNAGGAIGSGYDGAAAAAAEPSGSGGFGHRQRVSELWTPSHTMQPPPPARQSYHQGQHARGHGHHPSLSGSIPTPAAPSPSSPVRSTRAMDDALKRGSDPMLAAKLKEIGAARSASNRAQSLDMSSSFSHHRSNYSLSSRNTTVSSGPTSHQSPPLSAVSSHFPREKTLYNSAPRPEPVDEISLSGLRLA